MSDSLIAQLKQLAEAQKIVKAQHEPLQGKDEVYLNAWEVLHDVRDFDWVALIAHMQAQQAVCEQAGFVNNMIRKGSIVPSDFHDEETRRVIREVFVALDAALENLENNDGK